MYRSNTPSWCANGPVFVGVDGNVSSERGSHHSRSRSFFCLHVLSFSIREEINSTGKSETRAGLATAFPKGEAPTYAGI